MLRRLSVVRAPKSNIPFARQQVAPLADRSARAPSRVGAFANKVESTKVTLLRKDGRLYTFFAYIWRNMNYLVMYQLFLEGMITSYFFAGLQAGTFTVEGLHKIFVEWLKIPESWVGLADAHYTEDYQVPGLSKTIPKEKMTIVHTAHNVAVCLLPLQFLVILVTFPLAKHAWVNRLHPALSKVPGLSWLVSKPTTPNEFADKVMWATAQKRKDEMARQASEAKVSHKKGFRR
eukprot:GILI01032223.1.p1 GENE.GILI01032223.1~~GILI01032223.1.p1  ORF type:complete len:233 (-),score=24.15 GILI01032223.1:51-749(-)